MSEKWKNSFILKFWVKTHLKVLVHFEINLQHKSLSLHSNFKSSLEREEEVLFYPKFFHDVLTPPSIHPCSSFHFKSIPVWVLPKIALRSQVEYDGEHVVLVCRLSHDPIPSGWFPRRLALPSYAFHSLVFVVLLWGLKSVPGSLSKDEGGFLHCFSGSLGSLADSK